MRMRTVAGVLLLSIASVGGAAEKQVDGTAPVVEGVAGRKSIKYWTGLTPAITEGKMQAVFGIEGRPGPAPVEVQREVQGIWDRLLAASPVTGHPTVYVDDCSDRTAEALVAGATRICWGYLRDFHTEDQVAAVLGHEMSHLILGHTKSGRSRGSGFAVLEGLFDVAVTASVVAGGGAAPMFAAVIGGNDALAVPTGWLDRANRAEESEADRLGIDLMVRAGFNAGGLPEVFQIEGFASGSVPPQRQSPKLALMIDTSKRFTHPDDGKRNQAAFDYIGAHYATALDRPTTPLPWDARKPGGPGSAFFRDADDAERIAVQANDARKRLVANPQDKVARANCTSLTNRAQGIARRYPQDRSYRRFYSAVALGCGDENKAFDALEEEIAPTQRTVPGQFQALAISSLSDRASAAKLYGLWLREDFVDGLKKQKPSALSLFGLQSDAVDIQYQYDTFSCLLDVPELKAVQDGFCNQMYGGTAAAHTCSHQYDIKGVCASDKYFPNARPIGPIAFLRSQSRWYAAVLG